MGAPASREPPRRGSARRTALGVALVLLGCAAFGAGGAILLLAVDRGDESTAITVASGAGFVVGVLLAIVGAEQLSDRGRARLGGALSVAGLVLLGYGIYRAVIVWDDDTARMDQAALLAGLILGGIGLIVIGLGTISKSSDFDWPIIG